MTGDGPDKIDWMKYTKSPLTLFAGVLSLLESVVLIYLVNAGKIDGLDGAAIVLMTVAIFSIIVIGRPEALYPPERWKKPPPSANARLALIIIALFLFLFVISFAININGHILIEIFGR
jgi:hypothetical protein